MRKAGIPRRLASVKRQVRKASSRPSIRGFGTFVLTAVSSTARGHHCVVYWKTVKFADNALPEGSHLLIEGELSYREHDRTIETDSGLVEVKWPVVEIIVQSVAALNRHRKEAAAV
jgi:hypothetical protein